ncbi:CheY-like chemotaxis protein [Jejuia pallidilutea]|uniref:CheY-like chemotaxis protein n=1 Tax=Jejuia pallidilutea TaxID=504487 RepID=A0A362WZU0_9FLAO|nr:response regulator [Jejuia pallidilutea]PQV48405.1 CheY-like chemotaxis protein [Jejuia pallidilutea]
MISNIMIIDDSKIDLFVHQRIIEKFNPKIKVNSYSNPLSALHFIEVASTDNNLKTKSLPDIILLDVNMPEMNGFEFIAHLKKMGVNFTKQIEVFMLSSSRYFKDIHKAKKNSCCSGYISKPLTIEKLKGIEKQALYKNSNAVTQFFLSLV